MLQDQKNKIGVLQLLEAKSQAAGTITSKALKITDFRAVTVAINYGVFTKGTATSGVTAVIQESDTLVDADFADVPAGKLLGTFEGVAVDASNDQRSEWAGYCGYKKYIRLKIVVPANATSLLVGADLILGMGNKPMTVPTLETVS